MIDSINGEQTSEIEKETPEAFAKDDNGEDLLLVQIDAFRDKAKKLQTLISARERRVKELEALVRAKEAKNIELQESLNRQLDEADMLVSNVNTRVDELMKNVETSMQSMQDKIQNQVDATEDISTKQTKAVQDTLQTMNAGLSDIKNELSEKMHSENVKVYRNIQDLVAEKDNTDELKDCIESNAKGIKGQNIFIIIMTFVNVGAVICALLLQLGII
jgi:DNA repair exonuclease SbcCD ATPase subunit